MPILPLSENRGLWVRVYVSEGECKGCPGLVSGPTQNVSALGTAGSTSLTKLELDLGRSAEVSLAGTVERKACHVLACSKCRKDGARVEEAVPRRRESFGNVLSGMVLMT